jgi:hypothetical protein
LPYYTFENIVTEVQVTLEMSMAEREDFIKNNPQIRQIITNFNMIHDVGGIKTDNGWKDMLGRIKKANRGSTINTGNLGET